MRDGGIGKLDVRRGDLRITLETGDALVAASASPLATSAGVAPVAGEQTPGPIVGADDYVIRSPMIGTFYAAPAPGEPPFVHIGDEVTTGQTIAIIEAMKIMNEIVAERAGVVVEILATNGEAVEYGHPLMRLRGQS
jgi:acetyl-CoA carboxylase biotin carboxyl carrier protein